MVRDRTGYPAARGGAGGCLRAGAHCRRRHRRRESAAKNRIQLESRLRRGGVGRHSGVESARRLGISQQGTQKVTCPRARWNAGSPVRIVSWRSPQESYRCCSGAPEYSAKPCSDPGTSLRSNSAIGREIEAAIFCFRKDSAACKGAKEAIQRGLMNTESRCKRGNGLRSFRQRVSNPQPGGSVDHLRHPVAVDHRRSEPSRPAGLPALGPCGSRATDAL